ncbi:hypothetical protein HK405_000060 [Cladochytrium tenue]|nr:hypothetical protein HK405_000060 [Cladochytrium tenue]
MAASDALAPQPPQLLWSLPDELILRILAAAAGSAAHEDAVARARARKAARARATAAAAAAAAEALRASTGNRTDEDARATPPLPHPPPPAAQPHLPASEHASPPPLQPYQHQQQQSQKMAGGGGGGRYGAAARVLVMFGGVSRRAQELADGAGGELLWRSVCRERWRGKKHIRWQLHPLVDYAVPDVPEGPGIATAASSHHSSSSSSSSSSHSATNDAAATTSSSSSFGSLPPPPSLARTPSAYTTPQWPRLLAGLTVRELRGLLVARRRPELLRGAADKDELRRAVARGSLPPYAPPQRGRGFTFRCRWKASFMVAERDRRRTKISKDELCEFDWCVSVRMMFHQWPDDQQVLARFNRDFTYDSDMNRGQKMNWRFYLGDVQVEQFPALVVERVAADWGFRLNNNMAVLTSLAEIDPDLREEEETEEQVLEGRVGEQEAR